MIVIFASCTVVSSTVPVSSLTSTLILLLQKLFKNVGLIAKLRYFLPRPILLNIYLTYGLTAWGQACKTYILKKLNSLEKSTLFIVLHRLA